MALETEKHFPHASSPTSPYSPDGKTQALNYDKPVEENDLELRLSRAQTTDKKIKHRVRVLRVIQRFASAITSVFVLGVMLNTYLIFTTHKTANINGSIIQIYPKMPLLWPTYMMIATATVSVAFDLATLFAYCISMCTRKIKDKVSSANAVSNLHSKVGYAISIINFVVWLATSTTFKMMQGDINSDPPPNDLFGFSCSTFTDQLTETYQNAVPNFDIQCKTQTASFWIGIAKAALELLALIITIFSVRRYIQKKKVARLENRSSSAKLSATH